LEVAGLASLGWPLGSDRAGIHVLPPRRNKPLSKENKIQHFGVTLLFKSDK
jgi:hypothetical protein